MYISEQLKQANIAEYLLYMWQIEDTIRAYNLDIDKIASDYIPKFKLDEERSETLKGWYESLIQMMHEEGVEEQGHLQINKNIILLLTDLHLQVPILLCSLLQGTTFHRGIQEQEQRTGEVRD